MGSLTLDQVAVFLRPIGISIIVLAAATIVQVSLKVTARKDATVGATVPQMFTWEDAIFWNDWTSNILLALGIFALQSGNTLPSDRLLVLGICAFLGFVGLTGYVRWFGTDPYTGKVTKTGMKVSNSIAGLIILVALIAGVDLFK